MQHLIQSPNTYTRVAGSFYLLIIALGIVGQLFIRDGMVDFSDAALTVQNLLTSPLTWRLGATGDLLMQALDIPVMIILYFLLRPVNHLLAVIAVSFNLMQTAVLIANKLLMLAPLVVLNDSYTQNAFSQQQIEAIILLLADLHDYGFALGLVFFGFATIGYGLLIYRSGYLPKPIGILMMLAGLSYLVNSFTLVIYPALSGVVFPVLLLSLIGELSFALWLLIKGVDMSKWAKACLKTQ